MHIKIQPVYNNVVAELNDTIRERVNPRSIGKKVITKNGLEFRDGDRVVITKNSRTRDCSNGDVGTLRILDDSPDSTVYYVELPDGRTPRWKNIWGVYDLTLAYAMTIHKSQGSEYDTVLMPIFMSMQRMLSRNLFYTAISRAKREVILYGSPHAVDVAMQKTLPPRKSMLVAKTHMHMQSCA